MMETQAASVCNISASGPLSEQLVENVLVEPRQHCICCVHFIVNSRPSFTAGVVHIKSESHWSFL